jgi:hypothetical protein
MKCNVNVSCGLSGSGSGTQRERLQGWPVKARLGVYDANTAAH